MQEKGLFYVFRTQTSHQVAGTFEGTFWSVDVLQACQMHPAIWHSATAIAAMQIRKLSGQNVEKSEHIISTYDELALKQYNKALSQLSQATKRPDPSFEDQSLILIATVLLLGFSSLRGNFNEAKFFAAHGLRLFKKWKFREAARKWRPTLRNNVISVTSLITLLDQIQIQYAWACRVQEPMDDALTGIKKNVSRLPFESMTDAYHELQALQSVAVRLIRAWGHECMNFDIHAYGNARKTWLHNLSVWKSKFAQLRHQAGDDKNKLKPLLVLQMGLISLQTIFQVDRGINELCWDRFIPNFDRIVGIAQQLMELETDANGKQGNSNPLFTFAPSPVGTLYMVASACRENEIRSKALSLLKRWRHRDGMMDSGMLAAMADAKIQLEEQGCDLVELADPSQCNCMLKFYICRYHRVMETGVEFVEDGLARLEVGTFEKMRTLPSLKTLVVRWDI